MQVRIKKKLSANNAKPFWLSILLHALLLLSFSLSVVVHWSPPVPQQLSRSIPSYTYTEAAATASSQRSAFLPSPVEKENNRLQIEKHVQTAKKGILPRSMLLASYNVLQQEQYRALSPAHHSEPIYLIGNTNDAPDPLVRLLGKALSAHFRYPHIAGEFGRRGRTLIGMILHPDGYLTDIQIIKSSNSDSLDAAALYAVNHAPLVRGADRYLTQPKHFLVYFVFG